MPPSALPTKTHPLKHLLPPNIHQPRVQIAHFPHDLADLAFIRALDGARLADGQIQRHLDPRSRVSPRKPPTGTGVAGRETDAVVAAVGGAEGEFPVRGALGRDDAVVGVEGLVHRDQDREVGRWFRFVVAWKESGRGLEILIGFWLGRRGKRVKYQQRAYPWAIPRRNTSGWRCRCRNRRRGRGSRARARARARADAPAEKRK